MAMKNPSILTGPQFLKETEDHSMTTVDPTIFSAPRFLKDVEEFCKILNTPFSASTTQAVLRAYDIHFNNAPVGWRATSKDSSLNYRFFQGRSSDTVDIAIRAGFIKPSPMVDLVRSWTKLFNGEVQQWCDFDTSTGLAKSWLFLGQTRQMDDVLNLDFVPDSIRRHTEKFKQHGLDRVRTVAVDWHSETINIYWRAPGPISKTQADGLLGLAGCGPLDQAEVDEICRCASAKDGSFAFAVTVGFQSGEIGRAAIYATKLPRRNLPEIGNKRLETFLDRAPDYDPEEWITIGWGFVKGGKKYMKAEKSYCGKFMEKVKNMMIQDPNL